MMQEHAIREWLDTVHALIDSLNRSLDLPNLKALDRERIMNQLRDAITRRDTLVAILGD